MRVRIVQTVALVALLHTLTPFVEPTQIQPGQLGEHYGETVRLTGRVAAVEPMGEFLRVEIASQGEQATVFTRAKAPPLGSQAVVRGQPAPGQAGPILWAEGALDVDRHGAREPLAVTVVLAHAPQLVNTPIAVAGTWSPQDRKLVGPTGQLSVEPVGIAPEPGRTVLWGRLTYEAEHARFELEATGWRPWSSLPP